MPRSNKPPRLYTELAHLWPILDPPEEYALEASLWRKALRERLGPGRHPVLELGVGGGHLLSHLTSDFQATAVDLSPDMLALSRKLNPDVEHILGDMRSVRLGRKFRAVLIHDAVSYMLSEDDLRAAFTTAREHLEPGGVLITVPDWFRETFEGTYVTDRTSKKGGTEVTLIEYVTDPDPTDTTIETVFMFIINQGGELRAEEDRHVTGLFSLDTWLNLLREEGFEPEVLPYPVYEDEKEGYLLVASLQSTKDRISL